MSFETFVGITASNIMNNYGKGTVKGNPQARHARLVPGIHVFSYVQKKDVDGRAQTSGSDAVLWTAMLGHDEKEKQRTL